MTDDIGSAPADNPAVDASPTPAPVAGPLDGFQDADLKEYAAGKGFDKAGFEGVVKSYSNLEKLATNHETTVAIPGPDADAEVMGAFYNRLGRPEESSGYDLPVPEGDDGKMAEWASGVFHEAGLTAKQAALVSEKWNEHVGGLVASGEEQNTQSATDAEAELRREWGAAYDQKIKGIDQAAASLNMTAEHLTGLRATMGPSAAMRFVDGLAGKMGEAPTDAGGRTETGINTPAMASVKLGQLMMDPNWADAWMNKSNPGHAAAVEQKAQLSRESAGVL